MSPSKKTAVFLIVDDKDQRNMLATGLRESGYDVYDYVTAREFLTDERNQLSGVVVCDDLLRGMTGMELYEQLAKESSALPFVLMTKRADFSTVIAKNVEEFIVRPATVDAVKDAVKRVIEGVDLNARDVVRVFKRLTTRELEVGELVAAGYSRSEISELLHLSIRAVDAHRRKFLDNLHTEELSQVARWWRVWKESTKSE